MKNIFAYTALGPSPAYCSINEDENGVVIVTVRAKDGREASVEIPKAEAALLQQGEPEGWKLVPVEPTVEQLEAMPSLPAIKLPVPENLKHLRPHQYQNRERYLAALSASPLPPAPGAETGERKDHLADLVSRFSVALLEKLRAAEKKYGYDNGWLNDDWAYDLRRDLRKHIDKGDPRGVAAYCAFAWHHGWSTSSGTSSRQAVLEAIAVNKIVADAAVTVANRVMNEIGSYGKVSRVTGAEAAALLLRLAKLATTPPAEKGRLTISR